MPLRLERIEARQLPLLHGDMDDVIEVGHVAGGENMRLGRPHGVIHRYSPIDHGHPRLVQREPVDPRPPSQRLENERPVRMDLAPRGET